MHSPARLQADRWTVAALAVLMVVALVGITGAPGAAAVPAPIVPLEDGPPAEEEPPRGPYVDCLLQPMALVAAIQGDSTSDPIGRLLAHPGPLLPIDREPLPPCPSTVALGLVVVSPDARKPDGASATLDELAIPRPFLEAGFSTDLPAKSRTIRLSDPGENWKLMDISCRCAGGTAAALSAGRAAWAGPPIGRLTSYPGPVVSLRGNEPPGAKSGRTDCPGAASSRSVLAASVPDAVAGPAVHGHAFLSRPGLSMRLGASSASQPGPVLPQPGDPEIGQRPSGREPGSVDWKRDGTVVIDDPDQAGGVFSCVWTVEHGRGDLVLETKTEPRGREGRFSYRAVPQLPGLRTETIPGSPFPVERKMWKGAWSVALRKPGDAWKLESSECTDADPSTPSSAQGESGTAGIDPSDRVTCTFEIKLLAPKEGRWRGNEPPSRLSCSGGVSFRIPRIKDTGQLRVRQNGMRLIARGLSEGEATWRLDRENEDSRRFSGRIKYAVPGGKATFTLDLDMVSEERMKGAFKGDLRLRGQRCTVNKKITLDYIGG
jgi:hypothetical protein